MSLINAPMLAASKEILVRTHVLPIHVIHKQHGLVVVDHL